LSLVAGRIEKYEGVSIPIRTLRKLYSILYSTQG
jgi:hypothetical protein